MDDLIKRHDAIESVGFYSCHSGDKLLFADNALKNIPSVDAVEVVRCGECANRYKVFCPLTYTAQMNANDYDYCSRGEREENE